MNKNTVFPIVGEWIQAENRDTTIYTGSNGLTKRELFAAMAMQGMASYIPEFGQAHETLIANQAVQLADALLKALDSNTGESK